MRMGGIVIANPEPQEQAALDCFGPIGPRNGDAAMARAYPFNLMSACANASHAHRRSCSGDTGARDRCRVWSGSDC